VESLRVVVQERFELTAGCKVIPLKLELGTKSKHFVSVPSGTAKLEVGHSSMIKGEKYTRESIVRVIIIDFQNTFFINFFWWLYRINFLKEYTAANEAYSSLQTIFRSK
jgi:hypothetical protein